MAANDKFELRGINHLALVCRDMKTTVDFYSGVLGMPLTKTIELPNGAGQHFFSTSARAIPWRSFGFRTRGTASPGSPMPGTWWTRATSPPLMRR